MAKSAVSLTKAAVFPSAESADLAGKGLADYVNESAKLANAQGSGRI
jgi:hypothetical protein